MKILVALTAISLSFDVFALSCGEEGRASQSVIAWSGEKELASWEVTSESQIQDLTRFGAPVGVRVSPAPREHYKKLGHAGEWVPEIVKVEIINTQLDTRDVLVQGWGGANSVQHFQDESYAEGGLRLFLLKPVCVRTAHN